MHAFVRMVQCPRSEQWTMKCCDSLNLHIVTDGMEIVNGDFETLMLNIRDVMDSKAN